MGRLEVRNLSKRLGGQLAVDNITFSVEANEFFVLLGPSGGGKSTLLRLICGIETPDSGEIELHDRPITYLPPRERNLGMVFQDYGLYPNMNVSANIAYGLEARGMPAADVQRRVHAAAEKLGLAALLARSITDLSGGEQQRVALARALAKDAGAYLFDEPLSNLDPKLRHQARRDILALHREKGQPSVYVTHDQAEAFAMADRIGVIGHGRLQQVGAVDTLLNQPTNLFVARFVGAPPMNLLWCDLAHDGETLLAHGEGFAIRLPDHLHAAFHSLGKTRVVLGIRPDAITLATPHTGTSETMPQVRAIVSEVEPLIGETIVTLRIGRATSIIAMFEEADSFQVGDTVDIVLDGSRIILFDPDSEQALPQ